MFQVLVDTMDQVDRNYVKEIDRRELIEAAVKGVLSKLDPYSAYIGPKELSGFRAAVENEFGGIGIQITTDDGDLRILSPLYGTPAYRAGLLAGDWIVEIDGHGTEGLLPDEAIERLKGKEGSRVTLTVVHAGRPQKERLKVTLTRQRIHVNTVLGDHRKADDTWNFMLDDKQSIGYIRLSAFGRETAASCAALEQLRVGKAVKAYPNSKVVATTLRAVRTATRNDWGAICWAGGKFDEAPKREDLEVLDRVGGGDSFASGLIYGLMKSDDPQKAVEIGAAHGALAMTTPGDTSTASLKEVEALVKGGSARVQR